MPVLQCVAEISNRLLPIYGKGETNAITRLLLENFGVGTTQPSGGNLAQILTEQTAELDLLLGLLEANVPLQYALGYAWFLNRKFLVSNAVLIPRPETEELIDWILKTENLNQSAKILDVGTGSGCIAITLALALPHAELTAIDISASALDIAKENATILSAGNIQFAQMDFTQVNLWDKLSKFDVVVSNPPYIPINERAKLDQNVTDWEPAAALFVPSQQPLLFYELLAQFGKTHLNSGGQIYAECHQDYAQATAEMFENNGYSVTLKKDINNNDRMLYATLKSNSH